MSVSILILALVTLERLAELWLARINTARLMQRGALEFGASHYPLIVLLHAAWLAGLWYLAWNIPPNLFYLAVFIVLQVLRVWVLATLGGRWTTRVIVLPGEPLVHGGPFKWLSHPNYAVVIAEIAVLPLVFGLMWYALLFSGLNLAILTLRIRVENAALTG